MASEPPLILGFDTAAAHCAAAVLQDDVILVSRDESMARGQAERLLPMLEEMLAEADLDWSALAAVAVCTGPGNFTGLRLAVATARGLALALDIPAIGVSVFEALAAPWPGRLLVTLEDRRGDTISQTFNDGIALSEPLTGDPERLGPFDPTTVCVGFRAGLLAERLGLVTGSERTRADLTVLVRIAAGRQHESTPPAPVYVRPADAMPSTDRVPLIFDDA